MRDCDCWTRSLILILDPFFYWSLIMIHDPDPWLWSTLNNQHGAGDLPKWSPLHDAGLTLTSHTVCSPPPRPLILNRQNVLDQNIRGRTLYSEVPTFPSEHALFWVFLKDRWCSWTFIMREKMYCELKRTDESCKRFKRIFGGIFVPPNEYTKNPITDQ